MTSKNMGMERYDRQNRTYGEEATMKLATSVAIIIGLSGGLATETCKNLVLSGTSNLILIDDGVVQLSDLNTGFYYEEKDIGLFRNAVLKSKLTELNPFTNITLLLKKKGMKPMLVILKT